MPASLSGTRDQDSDESAFEGARDILPSERVRTMGGGIEDALDAGAARRSKAAPIGTGALESRKTVGGGGDNGAGEDEAPRAIEIFSIFFAGLLEAADATPVEFEVAAAAADTAEAAIPFEFAATAGPPPVLPPENQFITLPTSGTERRSCSGR